MTRKFVVFLLALLVLSQTSKSALATFELIQQNPANVSVEISDHPNAPSWKVGLSPGYTDVTYMPSASATMVAQLSAEFGPTWTFTPATGGLWGTMTIEFYEPFMSPGGNSGGVEISANYVGGFGDPAITNLTFIQLIDTNEPVGGTTNPYIDPRPNTDALPFYFTVPRMAETTNVELNTISFSDAPHRPKPPNPDLMPGYDTYWNAELILASWAGGDSTTVTLYDGFSYGWYNDVFHILPAPQLLPAPQPYATPEPSSMALLVSGGFLIVIVRKIII